MRYTFPPLVDIVSVILIKQSDNNTVVHVADECVVGPTSDLCLFVFICRTFYRTQSNHGLGGSSGVDTRI